VVRLWTRKTLVPRSLAFARVRARSFIRVRSLIRARSRSFVHVRAPASRRGNVIGMTNQGSLTGIRVLDLSRLLPGPFCTQLLADLGADVVKVEEPVGGDYLRQMPPLLHDGTSALFHSVNRGKRSVTIDLKSAAGHERFLRLCADADVVVESFRPGVMQKLGLAPAELLRRFPRLIVASITGYGQDGPLRLRAGHDVNYVARAGALGLMAQPTLLPVQVADLAGGAWPAAMQICAALVGRARTGEGRTIDVSMKDGVSGMLAMSLARTVVDGPDAIARGGDLLAGATPCYGVYATRDGFFSVGALEPKFWGALCSAIGRDDLVDGAFDEGTRAQLAATFATKTTAEWAALLSDVDACCEPVLSPSEALQQARLVDVDIDGRRIAFADLGLDATTPCTRRAPLLGEHDAEFP
jgi:crotonobetainyl-CoA:carnitine CoA-transferase CaiB-like acyl-CoA transferase